MVWIHSAEIHVLRVQIVFLPIMAICQSRNDVGTIECTVPRNSIRPEMHEPRPEEGFGLALALILACRLLHLSRRIHGCRVPIERKSGAMKRSAYLSVADK